MEQIQKMAENFQVELPKRYLEFLENGEYKNLGILKLIEGYVTGEFQAGFVDSDLVDLDDLGNNIGSMILTT